MAEMTARAIDDLPDSDFAYIEPGGKVVDGKTEPRSLRHFPIHDAAHVRNALARLDQSPFGDKARAKVEAAAKRMGIGEPATKAWQDELKAEPMTTAQLDRWLTGKIPRRILMVPFGGPLPGGKAGLDLDGEYFDDATDLYGPYPALRLSRDRLVDWHHDNDPTGVMKGATLGHVVFDEQPEDEGVWADFWANAGEKRRELIARLEQRGVPLYGSSQAVAGAVKKGDDGHIETWPLIRHTITTSPQNTLAVVPPLKALLAADDIDGIGWPAVRAALVGLDADELRLRESFPAAGQGLPSGGDGDGKAGRVLAKRNEDRVEQVIELMEAFLAEHRSRLAPPPSEDPTT